jgi:hypothetical protein
VLAFVSSSGSLSQMNLFRTLLATEEGDFLVLAEHDNSKVMSLRAFPISHGVVGEALPFGAGELGEVVKQIEQVLAE